MAFDFPNAPANGAIYSPVGGPDYVYNASTPGWELKTSGVNSAFVAKAGDVMSGSLGVGINLPANISTSLLQVMAGGHVGAVSINGYTDNTGAPRYLAAGPAAAYSMSANYAAIYIAPPGAAGAPITWKLGPAFDALGNMVMPTCPVIPSDVQGNYISASDVVVNAHFAFNSYVGMNAGSAAWKRLAAGWSANLWQDTSTGNVSMTVYTASGAAGSLLGASNSFVFGPQGNLTLPVGSMLYGGKVIMAIATTGGNAFVGSWDQQYTSAMGMWNYQAQLWFGAADGGGTPSAGYLSITGLRVQTATGCYIMSGSSLYAQGDTNFGLFQTGSSSRHMQFAGNWHWAWDMSSGALGWNTPSGQAMSIIYAGINVSGTITSGSNQTNGTLVVTGTAYLNATTQFYSLPGFSTFGGGANGRYYQLEGNHYIVKDPATADGNHYNGNGGNIYHQNTAGWSRIQSDGQFVISSNGWKPGGGSWADSSDARIKRVHADYTRGLAEIIQLHPRIYSFLGNEELILRRRLMNKSARSMGHLPHVELDLDEPYPDEFTVLSHHADVAEEGNTYIGLVAQEAEAHMPEMVSLAAATIDGEIVADLRMMDTSALPYAMINAFKEIDARLRAGGL